MTGEGKYLLSIGFVEKEVQKLIILFLFSEKLHIKYANNNKIIGGY